MCRTRVRSGQWQTREVLQDALAAMSLFEEAGDAGGALEAASLAAAFASRLGEMSLAAELATSCILAVGRVHLDDRVLAEVANRLGIFCYSFLDYDRAVEQFEVSLAAAERCGDAWMICRQLHNIAAGAPAGRPPGPGVRSRRTGTTTASAPTGWKKPSGQCGVWSTRPTDEIKAQLGVQRLQADLLVELGRPAEALEVLRKTAGGADAIVWAAGRASAPADRGALPCELSVAPRRQWPGQPSRPTGRAER